MALILLIACAIMLATIIAIQMRMQRQLKAIHRIQLESTKPETLQRLRSIDCEKELFGRFIDEDFSREELPKREKQAAFQRWKIANG